MNKNKIGGKMKKKSKIVLILAIISLSIFIFGSVYTYAKYLTKTTSTITSKIKNWDILVNNESIRGKSVLTNKITATFPNTNGHTKANKIAPGVEGKFTISIDYSHVDLNFSYDLSIAENETIPDIKLNRIEMDGVELSTDHISVDDDGITHITGEIEILDTDITKKKDIVVYVKWDDSSTNEMDNEEDTEVGVNEDSVNFDVKMTFVQLNT